MGFYVNLEMPKDCPMCPFAHYDMFNTFKGCDITRGKRCAVINDKDYAKSPTIPDWCPLVEVPNQHGRLIDADEMFDEFVIEGQRSKRYKLGEKWELNGEEIRSVISRLSTVIPASEEGE